MNNMRAVVNTSPFCEKDEVHELGSQLTKQPFNILANKRLKRTKPLVTECKDSVSQIHHKEDILESNSLQLVDHASRNREASLTKVSELLQGPKNSNIRLTTFQTHFSSHSRDKHRQPLKMNQTVSVKRSRQSEECSSSKKSESSLDLSNLAEERLRVKAIERENNQGQLKDKHLMSWLNQILVEYCFEKPLENGQLKALERFGLDQTTLLSHGMTLPSSNRLYKMLFVYSMGFSNVLKELGTTRTILKAVWKVYAVLLEYCSAGNFETIMGELERDTMKNEERLVKEIEKRQEVIDSHEEIIEERLHKYSKENKELTLRVKSLEEKTEVLEKEFREMEMAYNMEVSLRLAYQYKINEIYSVHERLNIIHRSLYAELQERKIEDKKLTQECWQAKQMASECKADREQLTGEMVDLRNAMTLSENLVEGLRMNELQLRDKLYAQQSTKREEVLEMREKEKKIAQLEREVSSGNLMVGIMKSSADSQLQEYRRLMLENSDLRRLTQGQLEKNTELLSDIKFLNSKESTLKGELAHAELKILELQDRLTAQFAVNDDLTKQLEAKEVELRTKCVEYESQKHLAESVQRNMQEIKIIYERLEEDSNYYRKYGTEMNKKYELAHQRVMTLELEVKAVQEQKFEVELDLSRKCNEVTALRKKFEADANQHQRQYETLHKLWSGQDNTQSSLEQQLATCQADLETANIRISFLSQQFTDLNFEKSKIEAIYNDNLVLHDKQKDAQKTLLIQISTLNEQLQNANRTIELTLKTAKQQLDKLSAEKAQLEKLLRQREAALKRKEGFVHPMLLEDALETLKRQIESHYSTRITLENEVEKENEKNSSLSLELQRKEADFRQHVKELERRADKMHEEIKNEREYFHGKSEQLNALIYSLETQLTFKAMEVERKDDNSSEAKFAELMRTKNAQIQELLGELERIEDSYQQKCTRYEDEISHIHHEKEAAIVNLKQSKKELETKVIEIEKTYQEKLEMKEKEKEAIVQKMLEERAIAELPEEEEERPTRPENKRNEFIARLKFANAYYHK